MTIGVGSTFYVAGSQGPTLMFRLPEGPPDLFNDPDSPVLSLPPLGLLFSATDVTRHGNVYSFEVPRLYLSVGWVAYAPL